MGPGEPAPRQAPSAAASPPESTARGPGQAAETTETLADEHEHRVAAAAPASQTGGAPDGDAASPSLQGHEAIRQPTAWEADYAMPAAARVALAEQAKLGEVKQLFAAAAIDFPPAELLLRAFKRERLLEVWASATPGGRMSRIATYEICALSGQLGPKRREGDYQVPEGYYRISYLWPLSAYHLSMNIGYPNRSDRILGGQSPGSAIMIHGNCASIGCLAMSDERIQELWVMATAMQQRGERVHVHLFPSMRMDELLGDEAFGDHRDFWLNLREGLELFEQHRRLPRVDVDWQGRYTFAMPGADDE